MLTGNTSYGILLDSSNDFGKVLNNTFLSTGTSYSVTSYGTDAVISNNFFTGGSLDSGTVRGPRSLISNNTFNSVRNGFIVNNSSTVRADRIVIRDNTYTTVSDYAIYINSGNVLATNNTVRRAGTAAYVSGASEVRNNVVSEGTNGISAYNSATVVDNRVFNNSNIGLILSNAINSGNRSYNNNIGIHSDFGNSVSVTNNFVYNNTSVGIQVYGNGYYGGTPIISNNTFFKMVVWRYMCTMAPRRTST